MPLQHAGEEVLPHVYTSSAMSGFSSFGTKYLLPLGTTRHYFEVNHSIETLSCLIHYKDYEEVTVPPAKTVAPRASERPIPVSELPPIARGSFTVISLSIQHSNGSLTSFIRVTRLLIEYNRSFIQQPSRPMRTCWYVVSNLISYLDKWASGWRIYSTDWCWKDWCGHVDHSTHHWPTSTGKHWQCRGFSAT
jgi:hypothetical protein